MLRLAALILPLSLDTFAVSAAIGASGIARSRRTRLALTVAAVQGLMPLLGVGVGAGAGRAAGSFSEPLAAVVLIAVGVFMLRADGGADVSGGAGLGGFALVALCLSVSIDELAIGLTAGLLRVPILIACALIALQGFAAAQLGLRLGSRVGVAARENAERLAAVALIALGAALLLARTGLV